MWKKTEESPLPNTTSNPTPPARRREAAAQTLGQVATLGASISIAGDLTGDEDLIIQGRIEGEVSLKKNNVTVGKQGRIKADIYGRSIRVEGEVFGNLFGEEEVIIRETGKVQGNITAPRVSLENGSKFKGNIDMEPRRADSDKAAKLSAPASQGTQARPSAKVGA